MRKVLHRHQNAAYNDMYFVGEKRRRYGVFHFLFDCLMVLVTQGLWLIWIFIREMRKR